MMQQTAELEVLPRPVRHHGSTKALESVVVGGPTPNRCCKSCQRPGYDRNMVDTEPQIQPPEVLAAFVEFVDWLRSRPGVKVKLKRGEGLGAEFQFQNSAFGWEELAQFYRACDGFEFAWRLNRRPEGAFSMAAYVPIIAPPEGGYDDLDDDPNPAAHIGLEDPEGKFALESRVLSVTTRDEPILLCAGAVGLYDGDYVIGWCDTLAQTIAIGIRFLFVRGWKNALRDETVTEDGDLEKRADALWAKLGPPPERIATFLGRHVPHAPLPFPAPETETQR